jgi:SagB-type dehydrogenase family enzyme
MRRRATFLRSPHIVSYWDGADLMLYNYAARTELIASVDMCAIVNACDAPRTAAAILPRCSGLRVAPLADLLRLLVRYRMLYRNARAATAAEGAMKKFHAWNPAAGFFHQSTKDVPFGDRASASKRQRARAQSWPMPAPVKRIPSAAITRLPDRPPIDEFPKVLLARRTWRRFADRPVDVADLAQLLRYTAGIHQWQPARGLGRSALRTSPSGGARHSIEVYIAARRVRGVRPGLYHYASDKHELERVRAGLPIGGVERYLPEQPWFEGAAALVFFAASFERLLWRYDYSRAYRAVLIEAGHLCQTFCLTATWLGLAPFCSMALSDSSIERDLKLDGITESVLYAAGVGVRGHSPDRAMAPHGVRPQPLIRNRTFA